MVRTTIPILLGVVLVIAGALAIDPAFAKQNPLRDESFETNHWAVELSPGADPFEIAARHGHNVVGKINHLPGVFIFEKKADTKHGITHPHHNESAEITWVENQVATLKEKRTVPSDPLYADQWHLHSSGKAVIHVNVEGAWAQGITGEGVTIGVVDDGLERTHADLQANYAASSSWDFNYNDPDPFPDSAQDGHGTSAAGMAAARDNNGHCGVGSAYRASVSGLRLISIASTDSQESSALTYKWHENHIYTNSWGPIDDGRRLEGPGRLATAGLASAAEQGRDGKGSIYVWAGGNGRGSGDNCNYDGWANSRFTITVGAIAHDGTQAYYSESCSMLLVSAPSSGASLSMTTTDLSGSRGSNSGDCTSSFGGTSAAAPLVAGVVALVLQKNPNLGWRDVQGVLLESAVRVAPSDSDWIQNGGGYWVNHKFGFGMVDATAAVTRAGTWTNLPAIKTVSGENSESQNIPEMSFLESTITITEDFTVEHVMIYFSATHPKRGELVIQLISPSGTVSHLAEKHNDNNSNYSWTFGSIFQWGESSKGVWKLRVEDAQVGKTGVMNSWKINIYGH